MGRTARLPSEGRYLDMLGGALWLANQREQAAAAWQRSVHGLLDGTITYASGAGGVTNALLLLYAGISLIDPSLIAEAKKTSQKMFQA
ncbi:hypothetical protein BH10PSE7_BH10PSE7_42280 [soil metagenome]